jgi:hypothetical protein
MPKIKVNDITINYEQQGGGGPLVLIPYLAADNACGYRKSHPSWRSPDDRLISHWDGGFSRYRRRTTGIALEVADQP